MYIHVPLLHQTGGECWASDCCVGWLPGPALVHIVNCYTISTDTDLAVNLWYERLVHVLELVEAYVIMFDSKYYNTT